MKGDVSIPVAALIAGIGMLATGLGAFYSAQLATADRFATDEISIATTRNDILHINLQLDRLEKKLDALLEKQNINPAKFHALEIVPMDIVPMSTPLSNE
jgi:hypothetical protein